MSTTRTSARWIAIGALLLAATVAPAGKADAQSSDTQSSEAGTPAAFAYQSFPPGSVLDWMFDADVGGGDPLQMRVLAAGPDFMILTDLRPLEFLRDDYALFVEYRGVGVFDCRTPIAAPQARKLLLELDALWPLTPGAERGRFRVGEPRPASEETAPPDGGLVIDIFERLEDSEERFVMSADLSALVYVDWAAGDGADRLVSVTRSSAQPVESAVGAVPSVCRDAYPDWFWDRLGF